MIPRPHKNRWLINISIPFIERLQVTTNPSQITQRNAHVSFMIYLEIQVYIGCGGHFPSNNHAICLRPYNITPSRFCPRPVDNNSSQACLQTQIHSLFLHFPFLRRVPPLYKSSQRSGTLVVLSIAVERFSVVER